VTEIACNPPFKLTVTKNNFTCIQCADKERFKTLPKQSLAYRFQNAVTLLVAVFVSDVSDIKVTSSTVTK